MLRQSLAVCVVLAAVTACTGDSTPKASAPSGSGTSTSASSQVAPPPGPARVAWRTSFKPVSGVVRVGDIGVVNTVTDGNLQVVGFDLTSGRTVWHKPATTAMWTRGVALYPDVIDNKVVVIAPDPDPAFESLQMLIVDPKTGRTLKALNAPKSIQDHPKKCHTTRICVALESSDNVHERFVVDPVSGGSTTEKSSGYGESIGNELTRTDAYLIHRVTQSGKVVWSVDLEKLLGPGYSTNWGWNFHKVAGGYLGTVNSVLLWGTDAKTEFAASTTIFLDENTGKLRWKRKGIDTFCLGVVPGTSGPVLGCQWSSGTSTWDASKPDIEQVEQPGKVAAVGIDAASGRTIWSTPLGVATDKTVRSAVVIDRGFVVKVAGKTVSVNTSTGKPLSNNRVGWQSDDQWVSINTPEGPQKYAIGDVWQPVVERKNTPTTSVWPIPTGIGTDHKRLRIVSQPDAVVAYAAGD